MKYYSAVELHWENMNPTMPILPSELNYWVCFVFSVVFEKFFNR